jgi:hypothetical protein
MNYQKNTNPEEKKQLDSGFEKFPIPRTMPAQWDVSELTTSKTTSKTTPAEVPEIFEKFPVPRTMPGDWDPVDFKK